MRKTKVGRSLRFGLHRVAFVTSAMLVFITTVASYCQAPSLPVGVAQQSVTASVLPQPSRSIVPIGAPLQTTPRLWSERLRGSWVRDGALVSGDVLLADRDGGCEIVVSDKEHTAVKQAAAFLASDIEKIIDPALKECYAAA